MTIQLTQPRPTRPGLTLGQLGGILTGSPVEEWTQGFREFRDVLAALRAEGAAIPADTDRALELHDQLTEQAGVDAMGDPADVVTRVDLADVDAITLTEAIRHHALHRARLRDDGGALGAMQTALRYRALDALAADVPAVLAPLVTAFRTAFADVQKAVDAGIGPDTGPADIIDDDQAIAAWRVLVAPSSGVGRLTRLWDVRCRLVRVLGGYVPPAPRPAESQPDEITRALTQLQGSVYTEAPRSAPVGVPDGFARRGRSAWLQVGQAGYDAVIEFADPLVLPARRHDRDWRATVPADAPSLWELEAAQLATPYLATDVPDHARAGQLEQQWASGMPGIVVVSEDQAQATASAPRAEQQTPSPGTRSGGRQSRTVSALASDTGIEDLGGQ